MLKRNCRTGNRREKRTNGKRANEREHLVTISSKNGIPYEEKEKDGWNRLKCLLSGKNYNTQRILWAQKNG